MQTHVHTYPSAGWQTAGLPLALGQNEPSHVLYGTFVTVPVAVSQHAEL